MFFLIRVTYSGQIPVIPLLWSGYGSVSQIMPCDASWVAYAKCSWKYISDSIVNRYAMNINPISISNECSLFQISE